MNNKIIQGFLITFLYLVLGALGYFWPVLNIVFSLAILIAFVYFVRKDWIYSLYFLLVDIVVNPHGNLFDISWLPISVRELIFLMVLSTLLRQSLISRKEVSVKSYPWWSWALLASVLFGFIYGFFVNGFSATFDDANSYAYLLILVTLPFLSIKVTKLKDMLGFFFGNLMFLSILTIFLSAFFSHAPGLTTDTWYSFFRDMRIAEITLLVASSSNMPGFFGDFMRMFLGDANFFYRVFIPSQILIFLPLAYYFIDLLKSKTLNLASVFMLTVSASGLLISLSRSYLIAFILVIALALLYGPFRSLLISGYKKLVPAFAVLLFGIAIAVSSASLFPKVKPDLEQATFFETSAEQGRETAVTSRWTLLNELNNGIIRSFPFGAGMGANLVYKSDDPRLIEISDGIYQTYRFEWGYHDIVFKTGVFGVISLLLLALWIFRLIVRDDLDIYKIPFLVLAGVMLITNVFSPYLNHPLGAICLMFLVLLDEFKTSDSLD